jgi:uncharacterized protein (TIGR01777 family)
LLISGSAIGYYGISETNDIVDEEASGDDSFSSQLCQQWEEVASQATTLGIRTCFLRTGIVLGKGGGALSKMLLPFKIGLGGRIGQGKQWMSWIHLDDLIGIILYCIDNRLEAGKSTLAATYVGSLSDLLLTPLAKSPKFPFDQTPIRVFFTSNTEGTMTFEDNCDLCSLISVTITKIFN